MAFGSADIESAKVIQDFRNRLVRFENMTRNALLGVDSEVKRMNDWLRGENLTASKLNLRKAEEAVTRAQSELTQAKMRSTFDLKVSLIDEMKALQRAKARKEEAERRLDRVKHWTHMLDDRVMKMMAPCTALTVLLDRTMPNALSRLDRMVENLDAYFRPQEPS